MFRGRWLVGHVVVVLLAALFIRLGIWQLDRLHQRREHNRLVKDRTTAQPVAFTSLPKDPDAADFRIARAEGTYDVARQVMVRYRTYEGDVGSWVLTPLRLGDGSAVVVNRGWIPQDAPASTYRAPGGTVDVVGLVQTTQTRGRFGPTDPATGTLANLARVDLARYQRQVPYDLAAVWLQLKSQSPPQPQRLPRPLPPPELGEGPHFSYAMQWFGFTLVGLIGWPLLIRRAKKDQRQ